MFSRFLLILFCV
ncbi:hypothetical protein LINPERPRIM_LOCUS28960 [Linum perenne]